MFVCLCVHVLVCVCVKQARYLNENEEGRRALREEREGGREK